ASDSSSSAGFGGICPLISKSRLGTPLAFTEFFSCPLLSRRLDRPVLFPNWNVRNKVGRRISASISKTLLPVSANTIAIFADVVDFPSSFEADVNKMTFESKPGVEKLILVRMVRYCSAVIDCGLVRATNFRGINLFVLFIARMYILLQSLC